MPSVDSNGASVAYADSGHGEPALLLMPGWCAPRTVFVDIEGPLAEKRRVLSIDWRGHGESGPPPGDFGLREQVSDALRVIEESGAEQIVPVALAHAGWVAIELRKALGPRVPRIVLIEWIVTEPPLPFTGAIREMQVPARTGAVMEALTAAWEESVDNIGVRRQVETMRDCPLEMWARSAREIEAAYAAAGSPLRELAALDPPPDVLHLTRPLPWVEVQRAFAAEHPWFTVHALESKSHFPMSEVPEALVGEIERFASGRPGRERAVA